MIAVGTTGTAGPRNLMLVIFFKKKEDTRQFVPWTRRTRRTDRSSYV